MNLIDNPTDRPRFPAGKRRILRRNGKFLEPTDQTLRKRRFAHTVDAFENDELASLKSTRHNLPRESWPGDPLPAIDNLCVRLRTTVEQRIAWFHKSLN